MKFDPFSWHEVKANEEIQVRKGWLRLRCSAAAPLYVSAEGHEVCAGVASAFDLDLSEAVSFRLDAPKGVRVFLHRPFDTSVEPEGEVFTNIDRMPSESGSMAEVTRAMRVFELQRRAALREIRAERDALVAVKAERAEVVEDTAADDPADDQEASA